MQIATWNVNSLNARLPHVLDWLAAHPVDVLALQELKMSDDKFPHAELAAAGYEAQVHGQKTYNGVALLARQGLGVDQVQRGIPGLNDDAARLIAATIPAPGGPLRIVNGYFVNGQAPDSDKFLYKMHWLTALGDWLQGEIARHPRLALMGDFNIAPEDRDSHDPQALAGAILHTPEERQHFQRLLALGLHDAFRLFEQPERSYSWWDYRQLSFQKNRGLRIDHILISAPLKPQARACAIDRSPRKWPRPSDHAPVLLTLE